MKKKWFIGIDISKKTLDVVIYEACKKHSDETNYRKVSNSEEGYKELLQWFKSKHMFLEGHGIDYCAFMPLALKYSLGLSRGKNDKVDAERIAAYTYDQREKLVYSKLSDSTVLKLRELSNERKRLVKQRAEHETVLTEMKGRESNGTYIRCLRIKEMLDGEIDAVETEMDTLIKSSPDLATNYRLLLSIKGIGSVNAISTIVCTDNFKGFETARQYACYLGIAPFEHTSGTSVRGRTRVSRIGARQLKADLSQAAKSAIVWDQELKAYYERKIKEGKAFGVVLNAVKFKLVCRMFAVVRRGTPFVDLMTYKC